MCYMDKFSLIYMLTVFEMNGTKSIIGNFRNCYMNFML